MKNQLVLVAYHILFEEMHVNKREQNHSPVWTHLSIFGMDLYIKIIISIARNQLVLVAQNFFLRNASLTREIENIYMSRPIYACLNVLIH